jgi:hypothetical protein
MTRAHIIGDMHATIDGNAWDPLFKDFDVLLCTGDVGPSLRHGLPLLRKWYPDHPIVITAGNHEFYSYYDKHNPDLKTTYQREREEGRRIAESLDIHFLDNDFVVLDDGTKVIGSTFWTDFMLRPGYQMFGDAVRTASRVMNDYRCIKTGKGRSSDQFQPRDSIAAHLEARKWLQKELAVPHDGDVVVMTHHAPHPLSLENGRPTSETCACYASDQTPIMTGPNAPDFWFHGHIHRNRDYVIGNTRVICNPRGYPMTPRPNSPRENPDFIEDLVIEIGRELTPLPKMGM